DWRGDRPVLSAATRRGVPEIYGRRGCSVSGQGDPCDRGQPVHARRRRDRQVAEETFQGHISLHAQGKLLDKSGGNMVRGHHTASDPPRQFPVGSATRTTHRQLHHPLERKRSTVHVDRDSKGYYRQGADHRARLSEAAGQQPEPEVKNILLPGTSSSRRIRYVLSGRQPKAVELINDEDREGRRRNEEVRVIQLICAHVRPGARPEQSNPYRASMVLPRS